MLASSHPRITVPTFIQLPDSEKEQNYYYNHRLTEIKGTLEVIQSKSFHFTVDELEANKGGDRKTQRAMDVYFIILLIPSFL